MKEFVQKVAFVSFAIFAFTVILPIWCVMALLFDLYEQRR
jgi:hypothetical protein